MFKNLIRLIVLMSFLAFGAQMAPGMDCPQGNSSVRQAKLPPLTLPPEPKLPFTGPGWDKPTSPPTVTIDWPEQAIATRIFREYRVRHEFDGNKMVDKSSRITPDDQRYLDFLDGVVKFGQANVASNVENIISVIDSTDSALVVERVLLALLHVRSLPEKLLIRLHPLALAKDRIIKEALARTLARFHCTESCYAMLKLLSDDEPAVRSSAMQGLCYFGVESVCGLPFLTEQAMFGHNTFFLAKVVRHVMFLVCVAAGQQILPSARTVFVPGYRNPPWGNDEIARFPAYSESIRHLVRI